MARASRSTEIKVVGIITFRFFPRGFVVPSRRLPPSKECVREEESERKKGGFIRFGFHGSGKQNEPPEKDGGKLMTS